MSKINYGFVAPVITPDNYVLGSLLSAPKVVRNPSGNWAQWLPLYEPQSSSYETFGCTSWGTLNVIETMINMITGVEPNYSDRHIYNVVGINPPGHDPHDVAEKIRKNGLIPQSALPYTRTFEEFRTPRPMTKVFNDQGLQWLQKYGLQHEWIFTDLKDKSKRLELMKECLRYSPLGVAVEAWTQVDGEYVSTGIPNNHWCMAFRIDEKNRVWVFDSYDRSIKTLSADHDIQYAKRFHLDTIDTVKEKLSFAETILKAIMLVLSFLLPTDIKPEVKDTPVTDTPEPVKDSLSDKLLAEAKSKLGQDVTTKDLAPTELACVEAVTEILNKVVPFPIMTYTPTFLTELKKDSRFKATLDLKAGNIIVSPTGSGNGTVRGHAGILDDNGRIMSNSSATGKWEANYTIDGWVDRFRVKGKMPIVVLELVG